jgi:hypothetical protein
MIGAGAVRLSANSFRGAFCNGSVDGQWFTLDTPDLIGVARPHNGHYTTGAVSEP